MNTFNVVVNRLPVLTWNRLGMNHSLATGLSRMEGLALPGLCPAPETAEAAALQGGCGAELGAFLDDCGCPWQLWRPRGAEPERLNLAFAAERAQCVRLLLQVPAGQSAGLLLDYSAPAESAGQAAVQLRILLEEGASLHLVQAQRLGQGFTLFNDLAADCAEGAHLTLSQLLLSGQSSYYGCNVSLSGARSSLDAALGYALAGGQRLDLNYLARHQGRGTQSSLHAAGSLRAGAFKLFRGTIDFLRGSAGSVGSELEEVLLLEDNCVNQTIPLILCAEEDVEGNHGASIGRAEEETLFYLESRGIPAERALALLTRARLEAVAARIPEQRFREELLACIKEGECND